MAHLTFYQRGVFIIAVILMKAKISKYVERVIQVNYRTHTTEGTIDLA